jgi:hypothetical protein
VNRIHFNEINAPLSGDGVAFNVDRGSLGPYAVAVPASPMRSWVSDTKV